MGHRSYLIDLDSGLKVYLHWAATEIDDAQNFGDLTERVRSHLEFESDTQKWFASLSGDISKGCEDIGDVWTNPCALGEYEIVEYGIDEYTDEDAIEEMDIHIEALYVFKNGVIERAYSRKMLHKLQEDGADFVYFKVDDRSSFRAYKTLSRSISEYHYAYLHENIPMAAQKAISNACVNLRDNRISFNGKNVKIICSSVEPNHPFVAKMIPRIDPSTGYEPEYKTAKISKEDKEKAQAKWDRIRSFDKKEEMKKREQRAQKEDMKIKHISDHKYKIKDKYTVDLSNESCTCPDYQYRGLKCKHIHKVIFETE